MLHRNGIDSIVLER
jgi:p-hydroxybenzoate 3-monooxygenase